MARVLIIAPHPDDEVLGPGGSIIKHVSSGDTVDVVILCTKNFRNIQDEPKDTQQGDQSLEEAVKVKEILNYNQLYFGELEDETLDNQTSLILDAIEPFLIKSDPDILYVTHFGDNNQDHRAAYHAAQVLARPASNTSIKKILCYETPSSTDQTPGSRHDVFVPNIFNTLTIDQLNQKIQAALMYNSEIRQFPHPRSPSGIETYANYRGLQANHKYAEGLCLMRDII